MAASRGSRAAALVISKWNEEKKEKAEVEDIDFLTPKICPKVNKRQNYLPWEDYFMNIAYLSAMRSKDPSTQVGACIVNPDKRIVAIGYNGFPRGISDQTISASGSYGLTKRVRPGPGLKLQATSAKLQAASCKLQSSNLHLHVGGGGKWHASYNPLARGGDPHASKLAQWIMKSNMVKRFTA